MLNFSSSGLIFTITFKNFLRHGHCILASSGLYYKQVTIVIYDRNDIGLYYKTRDDRN